MTKFLKVDGCAVADVDGFRVGDDGVLYLKEGGEIVGARAAGSWVEVLIGDSSTLDLDEDEKPNDEPTPAFKVGDRVRVAYFNGLPVLFETYEGAIGTIIFDDGSDIPYEVEFESGRAAYFKASELELAPLKFKVGDRVEIVGLSAADFYDYRGEIGTVTEIDVDEDGKSVDGIPYRVEMRGDRIAWYVESSLKASDALMVGDRVEIVESPYETAYVGDTGVITAIDREPNVVLDRPAALPEGYHFRRGELRRIA